MWPQIKGSERNSPRKQLGLCCAAVPGILAPNWSQHLSVHIITLLQTLTQEEAPDSGTWENEELCEREILCQALSVGSTLPQICQAGETKISTWCDSAKANRLAWKCALGKLREVPAWGL